jgi:hypothetical protein
MAEVPTAMTEACQYLHDTLSRLPRLRRDDLKGVTPNGVYVLFENGEYGHDGERIVRVGTHRGSNNLAQRIREHLYTPNKDRSIFRKHVGRCILAKDPFLRQWEIDLTTKNSREMHTRKIDRDRLQEVENEVTQYMILNFSFAVMRFDEKPERFRVERSLLSTIYHCLDCGPSDTWLGKSHPNAIISKGKLWNIQGLHSSVLTLQEARGIIKSSKA